MKNIVMILIALFFPIAAAANSLCSWIPAHATTHISFPVNLNSMEGPPKVAPFDPNNPSTYNYTVTSTQVYDNDGMQNSLKLYFVNVSPNLWQVNAIVNFEIIGTGSIVFTSYGRVKQVSGLDKLKWKSLQGKTMKLTVDLSGSTQVACDNQLLVFPINNGYPIGGAQAV